MYSGVGTAGVCGPAVLNVLKEIVGRRQVDHLVWPSMRWDYIVLLVLRMGRLVRSYLSVYGFCSRCPCFGYHEIQKKP